FILTGAWFYPEKFNVEEIDTVFLNITFLIIFTFLGLFAAAAQTELLDKRIFEYEASTDNLTGMTSRRAFLDQLRTAVQNLRRNNDKHCLLYIDLDGLKSVNDTAGHSTGDLALKSITRIIRSTIRGQDIAGRLGGDEFAILLSNCDTQAAMVIAEKIRQAVAEYRISHHGQRFTVTASIGGVNIDQSSHDIETLIESADQACYTSKRSGGNRITLANVERSGE
ncbi:MAG: GGDEF domain-containing protein, partial [Gammaproteobacteria bacterium]|nr:GGDEF domain-containing protein [Gammaproteobacteria bacterium]